MTGGVQLLRRALWALYSSGSSLQGNAHQWLQSFQRSSEAWTVSLEVLREGACSPVHDQSQDVVFAAQTLAFKARKAWGEGGATVEVLTEMTQLAAAFLAKANDGVGSQLCAALCATILSRPATAAGAVFWDVMALADVVQDDVKERLRVRLLLHLPEEVQNRRLAVPIDRRNAILSHLTSHDVNGPASQASAFLTEVLSKHTPHTTAALAAFTAWLELGAVPFSSINRRLQNLVESAILQLQQPPQASSDVALEFLSSVLEAHPHPATVEVLAAAAPSLWSLASPLDAPLGRGIVGLMASLACACVKTVASPNVLDKDAVALLTPLLRCIAQAPLDVAALTFDVWSTLAAADLQARPQLSALVDDVLVRLLHTLVQRSAYPPDFGATASMQAREDLNDAREETREVYRSIITSKHAGLAVSVVAEAVRLLSMTCREKEEQWFILESVLHALSALGLRIIEQLVGPAQLDALLAAMHQVPQHPAVVRSAVLLLSVGSEVLLCRAEHLPGCFRVMLWSLRFSEDERLPFSFKSKQDHAGCVALLKLVKAGAQALITAVPQAADEVVRALHATYATAPEPLTVRSIDLLLEAAAQLAAVDADDQRVEALCGPLWESVRCGVEAGDEQGLSAATRALVALETVARSAAPPWPRVVNCFLHRDAMIKSLLMHATSAANMGEDNRLVSARSSMVEAACSATAAILAAVKGSGLGKDSGQAFLYCLESWGPVVAAAHEQQARGCFIRWATAALVTHPTHTQHASYALYRHIMSITCSILASTPMPLPAGVRDERSLMELIRYFFVSLMAPCASSPTVNGDNSGFCLRAALAADVYPQAITTALKYLSLTDREACKAVLGFLRAAIGIVQEAESVRDTIARHGPDLMLGLLAAVCGAMPSWMLDDVMATMLAVCDACGLDVACSWMVVCLDHPAFPRRHVSQQAKSDFVKQAQVTLARGDTRAFKTAVKAFCGGKRKGTNGTPAVPKGAGP